MHAKKFSVLLKKHHGKVIDKWSSYFSIYDDAFARYKDLKINLLEIGIQNGGSLEVYASYFKNAKSIVGCDIDPKIANLEFDEKIKLITGDVNLDETQEKILSVSASFDIIIDDGSHMSSDIIKSFFKYFSKLNTGGLYIVEDLHCSYFQEFEGGYRYRFSSMNFLKSLADIVNFETWSEISSIEQELNDFLKFYCIDISEFDFSSIHSVKFVNSICIIEKKEKIYNLLGQRQIIGEAAIVFPEVKEYKGEALSTLTLTNDSLLDSDMRIAQLELMLRDADVKLNHLEDELAKKDNDLNYLTSHPIYSFYAKIIFYKNLIAPQGTVRGDVRILIEKVLKSIYRFGLKVSIKKILKKYEKYLENKIYLDWVKKFEPNEKDLLKQVDSIKSWSYLPKISIIIPVYKVPNNFIDDLIKSLECQTYHNFEACLAWSDVENVDGLKWLKERVRNDLRFKMIVLDENRGISENSNSALKIATGDFLILLDHDDTLSPSALYENVRLLQKNPELDFIYSDKDLIDKLGVKRSSPLFKPAWSPEVLYSVNYLTHCNFIRTALVKEVGGWDSTLDGAQDWDLFFKITERTNKIAHIPAVLYHWRIHSGSTSSSINNKPYALDAQLRTISNHMVRKGLQATILRTFDGLYQICWKEKKFDVDIVIYAENDNHDIAKLLNDLECVDLNENIQSIKIHAHVKQENLFCNSNWAKSRKLKIVNSNLSTLTSDIEDLCINLSSENIILLDASKIIEIPKNLITELSGWTANNPNISWVSAVITDKEEITQEAGRVIGKSYKSAPMFSGCIFNHGTIFGASHWYRNSSGCSPIAVGVKLSSLKNGLTKLKNSPCNFMELCYVMTNDGKRGLINPFVRVICHENSVESDSNNGKDFVNDPYFHKHISSINPIKLSVPKRI